jgi:hypothetical protein
MKNSFSGTAWFDLPADFDPAQADVDFLREIVAGTIDPWFGALGWALFRFDESGITWIAPCTEPQAKMWGLRAFWDARAPHRVTVCCRGEVIDCANPLELCLALGHVKKVAGVGELNDERAAQCWARLALVGNQSLELLRHAVRAVVAEDETVEEEREVYGHLGLLGDFRRSAYARRGKERSYRQSMYDGRGS